MWAGVDVGARRKGFHVAVVDETQVVLPPARVTRAGEVAPLLVGMQVELVAVDSPIDTAPAGLSSREGERLLARRVCGIRYTPALDVLDTSSYYAWIVHGLELYAALERAGLPAIECFPTASWTRWIGGRGSAGRTAWTTSGLPDLGLDGVPRRLSQDGRDAIAAAVTARAHAHGKTEAFGPIVVPLARSELPPE